MSKRRELKRLIKSVGRKAAKAAAAGAVDVIKAEPVIEAVKEVIKPAKPKTTKKDTDNENEAA